LHMAQLMPLPLTVSCFSKIHIGFTFLVPAHLGSPGKRAVKRVCVFTVQMPIRRSISTVKASRRTQSIDAKGKFIRSSVCSLAQSTEGNFRGHCYITEQF